MLYRTRLQNQFKSVNSNLSVLRRFASSRTQIKLVKEKDVGFFEISTPNKSMNALSRQTMEDMLEVMKELQLDNSLKAAAFISTSPECFIAGADIDMFREDCTKEEMTKMSEDFQFVMDMVEKSSKPIIAAINGYCLGGGYELALACQYRIAMDTKFTKLGLPEVTLGLLPAGGGCVRGPYLMTSFNFLEMALSGKQYPPAKAKKMNMIDEIVACPGFDDDLAIEQSMKFFRQKAAECAIIEYEREMRGLPRPQRAKNFMDEHLSNVLIERQERRLKRRIYEKLIMKQVDAKTRGLYPAPRKIYETYLASTLDHQNAGLLAERENFGELSQTNASKSLRSIYHNTVLCKKNKFLGDKKADDFNTKKLTVVGGGFMGSGIAGASLKGGLKTHLIDNSAKSLEKSLKMIEKYFSGLVKRGSIKEVEVDKLFANFTKSQATSKEFCTDQNLKDSEVIIEAIPELLELKQSVFKDLESCVSTKCILASNTSALPISEIANVCKRPENVIGMHYFSPVAKMKLLEIIKTPKTSNETVSKCFELAKKQGKMPIVVNDGPGFYTTRVLMPMLSESLDLLASGVDIKRIDRLGEKLGFPVGPLKLVDEVGIDVAMHIMNFLSSKFKERMSLDKSKKILKILVDNNFLGRKSGKGFYDFTEKNNETLMNLPKFAQRPAQQALNYFQNKPKPGEEINQEAFDSIADHISGTTSLELADQTIQDRLMVRLLNECVLCLEEGILMSAAEGDIGAVFGIGFPPYLGGPFKHLDLVGSEMYVEKAQNFSKKFGKHFEPCKMLVEHSQKKSKFY